MSVTKKEVYDFVFKGLLTEEALDRSGRKNRHGIEMADEEIAETLSISLLPPDLVNESRQMAMVYIAVAAFENAVRELIAGVLLENKGENWWEECVSSKIKGPAKKRKDEELKIKWHTQRGTDLINYTTMSNLTAIMRNNWEHFEPFVQSIEWATNILDAVERSRNVIMHSGVLERGDIERLGIFLRDWVKQVGT